MAPSTSTTSISAFLKSQWYSSCPNNIDNNNNNNNNNNNDNNNNNNNPNLLLITKLTIKSYLQSISLKKLFRQSNTYIIPFDLKKDP